MPILKNAKWERFAQGLAAGKSQEQAYVDAGYSPRGASGAATKLCKSNASISERRDEILQGMQAKAEAIVAKAIEKSGIDQAWVLNNLQEVAERCMQSRPVLDRRGKPIFVETPSGEVLPAYVFNAMGANKALELIGKELQMFVERVEVGSPGDFIARVPEVSKTTEEWQQQYTQRLQ